MILTKAFRLIAKMKHRIKVIQGSQGAGKTGSILRRWIWLAVKSKDNQLCSIITDTFPNLRSGALKDFQEICEQEGVEYASTKTPMIFKIKGWTFEFFSVDKESKGIGARRDRLYINEAPRIPWKTARQLINRTHGEVLIDFNPTRKFWAHTQYVDVDDCSFLKLTYKENSELPPAEKEAIERTAPWGKVPDANFWRVYGLGEIGFVEGVIFGNYKDYDKLPKRVRLQRMIGIDFGWEDPLACIIVHIDKANRRMYWRQIFYASHASFEDLVAVIKNDPEHKGCPAICDSSDPGSIMRLRKMGLKAMGADKRAGITSDIRGLKQYELFVYKDSKDLKLELSQYKWQMKNDVLIDYPVDRFNHSIDAARYPSTVMINN